MYLFCLALNGKKRCFAANMLAMKKGAQGLKKLGRFLLALEFCKNFEVDLK